jgi:hypothetical protein
VVEIQFEFLRVLFLKINFIVSIFIRDAIEIRYARTTDGTRPVSRCSNRQPIDARTEKRFFNTIDDTSRMEPMASRVAIDCDAATVIS